MVDRLRLTPKVIDTLQEGCLQLAAMPDVIGTISGLQEQPSGIRVGQMQSISDNTEEIYDMWKTDSMLKAKNDYIASIYAQLSGEVTDQKIVLSLFANQILEGVYFYSGFAAIYSLGKSGKMLGSSQMIRFIQRDEVTHLFLMNQHPHLILKWLPKF